MMIEELAFVALQGSGVPYSHAVLVETWSGWQVELEDVPRDCRPSLEGECVLTFDTWDGRHYRGTASASYRRAEHTCLLLIGQGPLSRGSHMQDPEDVDRVMQSS